MKNACGTYTVEVHGYPVSIEVLKYTPFKPGQNCGSIDGCYPDDDVTIDWNAVSCDNLLDFYVNTDKAMYSSIETQLEALIKERLNEREQSKKIDDYDLKEEMAGDQ